MSVAEVCYDLSCSPPTYDAVSFILAAEIERRRRGADSVNFHILEGPDHGFRRDRLPPRDPAVRRRMLDAIVIPAMRLLPSTGLIVFHNQHAAPDNRNRYGFRRPTFGFPFLLSAALAGVYPLRADPTLVSMGGDYVTITLRESHYWPTRNSNLAEWINVGNALREDGYRVIIVRDTECADEPLGDFETAPQASRDLAERARLYAGARQNLFVNNGPAWLCAFMGAPCLIFKMISPGAPCVSAQFFAERGLRPGEPWPNMRPRQRVVWKDDKCEHIIGAFNDVEG